MATLPNGFRYEDRRLQVSDGAGGWRKATRHERERMNTYLNAKDDESRRIARAALVAKLNRKLDVA
jgi:hypothetical protein